MYTIAEAKTDKSKVTRVANNLSYCGETTFGNTYGTRFVPNPDYYGTFSNNIDAKRRVIELFHPEVKGCSDEHIRRLSKMFFVGKNASFKVVKVTKNAA